MRVPSLLVALACGLLLAGGLAGCRADDATPAAATEPGSPTSSPGAAVVPVSVSGCGTGWTPGPAGEQTLELKNVDFRSGEARVVSVKDGRADKIYAEVEPFGPGTQVSVDVRLGAGRYAIQCLLEDESAVLGTPVTITGDAPGGPGVKPVDDNQLILATWTYKSWVLRQLPDLADDVERLGSDVRSHDLADARRTWLRAHTGYERLGAAYDAFGDLDGAINGLPAGLPGAAHDPDFTGFHRIEVDLFGGAPTATQYAELERRAGALARDVRALRHQLGQTQLDPLTLTIRAHEITENLLQTQLTGADDLGSHSDLASIRAGLDGTAEVLRILHGQLVTRYSHTHALSAELARARGLVERMLGRPWAHRAVTGWPQEQRERLSAAIAGLSERLAPVASILEPRRDD